MPRSLFLDIWCTTSSRIRWTVLRFYSHPTILTTDGVCVCVTMHHLHLHASQTHKNNFCWRFLWLCCVRVFICFRFLFFRCCCWWWLLPELHSSESNVLLCVIYTFQGGKWMTDKIHRCIVFMCTSGVKFYCVHIFSQCLIRFEATHIAHIRHPSASRLMCCWCQHRLDYSRYNENEIE